LTKPKGDIWYYKKAAGRETLGNVVKEIMKNAGFERYFTNHSLRRTCATKLYETGVSRQTIQEITGHRSVEGVRAYKCTSSSMKRKVSEIVQHVDTNKSRIKMGKVGESNITGSGSSLMDVSTERGVCEDEDIKIKIQRSLIKMLSR